MKNFVLIICETLCQHHGTSFKNLKDGFISSSSRWESELPHNTDLAWPERIQTLGPVEACWVCFLYAFMALDTIGDYYTL